MNEGNSLIYLAASGPVSPPNGGPQGVAVCFDRRELSEILNVYGRMVAMGEWRDYAIGHGRDSASFAIFRRTSEIPLYRVVKQPRLRHKQGLYAVISATGHILKRGHSLASVLRVFERKLLRLVEAE